MLKFNYECLNILKISANSDEIIQTLTFLAGNDILTIYGISTVSIVIFTNRIRKGAAFRTYIKFYVLVWTNSDILYFIQKG